MLRVVKNTFGSLSRCSGMHTFRLRLANSFYLCICNSGSNSGNQCKVVRYLQINARVKVMKCWGYEKHFGRFFGC